MSRTWGRLYAGTRNHRKIKILREQFPDHWTKWYVILELAIECDDEGWIYVAPGVPFTPKQLSKELGFTRVSTSLAFLNALVTLQLATLNENGLLVNSFAERNFESDISTPRVQKYREKRKAEQSKGDDVKRFSNVSVTDQNRTETEQRQNIVKPPISPKGGCNGFDSFWLAYPKKIGKGAALKKWEGLKRTGRLPPVSDLITAVERQKTWEQWQKDEGQFIPNPATWLNQGRWDDQPPEGGPKWIQEHLKAQSTS